ncbi:hypothetical protein E1281_19020 [Actinomadura sp. KC345]|uniref:hypothetical protein n=1 Tax=Actinomadura sp. KC345 TaxID=2530371 RepID=UPI00104677FF|nr:hypothetical protein [Actinomadura sp. KC345]TDC52488.1 hypothetical protein E1281_19020 [Actinomadura sp. KC345]
MMVDGAGRAEADEVIARLKALESDAGGLVALGPSVTDAEMSSWPVSPPEDVRKLFRSVGGLTFGRFGFDFNHRANHTEPIDGDHYPLRDTSANWVLDDSMGASTTYYVDIDPETGAWGPVFSFWRDPYASLVAPSFAGWLGNLATGLAAALETCRDGDLSEAFSTWMYESEESLFRDHDNVVVPLPVPAALESGDPEIAEVAALLPADAYLADLRTAAPPTEVPFATFMPEAFFSRFRGGRFLAATPFPED